MDNEYVLAMYDIRGKQEYIYRSNHIKEIIGGSVVIRDCFRKYLYPAAEKYRRQAGGSADGEALYRYGADDMEFSVPAFQKRMEGGQYLGEVIYDGGGNFYVLYKNKDVCIGINKLFTREVLKETCTLRVDCTFIEGVNFADYTGDQKRLHDPHSMAGARDTDFLPAQVLPFTQTDSQTSMPLYRKTEVSRRPVRREKVTRESFLKYKMYRETIKNADGEQLLDNLVTERGEESLLAIVYIDGNNMGARVSRCLKETDGSYESCIRALRGLSADIQKNYIDDRLKAIDDCLTGKYPEENFRSRRRFVIAAGDEITFICNARDAYDVARAYLTTLPGDCSACAGIAVFHSHAPYADAYRIAEECCESGKQKMKAEQLDNACLMDVHYCQSGIGTELAQIRRKEVGDLISKPWFVRLPEENRKPEYMTIEMVEELTELFAKIARTNVKKLAESARGGMAGLKMELARIRAHSSAKEELDFTLGGKLNEEQMRRLIYDVVIMYDLWFRREKAEGGADE